MTATEAMSDVRWSRVDHRFKFSFGGVLLGGIHFPALTTDAAFLEPPACPALPLDTRAAIVFSNRIEEPLSRIHTSHGSIRYVRSQYRRFLIELDGTFEEYEKRFSSQRRKHLRSAMRKLAAASGGRIHWRDFRSPDEIEEFYSLAREVSRKTYQEKLADAGLPETPAFRNELRERAESDRVRGYILFMGGKPIAYQYCPVANRVISCERVGYDPEYRQHSPGFVLLVLMLENLFAQKRFEVFDFGRGEYSYKESLATSCLPCADVYYFRKSLSNLALVSSHAALESCSQALSAASERLGIRRHLKKIMRTHHGLK